MKNKKSISCNASKTGNTKLIEEYYLVVGELLDNVKKCESLESSKVIVPNVNSKKPLGKGVMFELSTKDGYFLVAKIKKNLSKK